MTERPLPVPDRDTAPFWEAAREGRLRIQRCLGCGRNVFYPRPVCPHCLSSELGWIDCSGRGSVYSYTVVHRTSEEFRDQVPFTVALVELEEGVRLLARLDVGEPRVGMPVEVAFERVSDELSLPHFKEVD
ncbi:MAG: Zn-ribbon domain-containing OB-fold protein [Chloroflexi bacterium]|nr:MAG: Zn-ribbon domain-containing OB-fold protein [Chloroflexota bacterium]TMD56403.1 MAG: Zn-ribbon domain-containing OB-fold protein [Chloroflexota bacterium]